MRDLSYSTLFWLAVALTSVVMFPACVLVWALTRPFDRRLELLHQLTSVWAAIPTWVNPAWTIRIEGRHKIPRSRPCVLVANHLSILDVMVLHRLFVHFKWVSKSENFRVPLVGWNMMLNRYVEIHRGNPESAEKMKRVCEQRLDEGSSILIFPEGTRSRDGSLGSFKRGAFEVALHSRVPIVPIVIAGTERALPKRGLCIRGHHRIRVTVLDPIEPTTFGDVRPNVLADRVRQIFAEHSSTP